MRLTELDTCNEEVVKWIMTRQQRLNSYRSRVTKKDHSLTFLRAHPLKTFTLWLPNYPSTKVTPLSHVQRNRNFQIVHGHRS